MMNKGGVTPKSLHQKWQFGVEINGVDGAYFEKADFPEVDFEVTEFSPAGKPFSERVAGRPTFNEITLERGVSQEDGTKDEVLQWIRDCMDFLKGAGIDGGGLPNDYLRDMDLVRYDRTGKELDRFRLYGAWIKTANFGEGDGTSSENNIESITVVYQYFDVI